ncbi:MAG: hypothetical protein RIS29_632 [Bacteroidota bacterium]|jgi:hypothetical protein
MFVVNGGLRLRVSNCGRQITKIASTSNPVYRNFLNKW